MVAPEREGEAKSEMKHQKINENVAFSDGCEHFLGV